MASNNQLLLHGGPLDSLYIDESLMIGDKCRISIERFSYRPNPKADLYFVWKICEDDRSAEMWVTYKMRDGKLCHDDFNDKEKKH